MAESVGLRRRQPAHLADETEQRGATNGRPEHRFHDGVDPFERVGGRRANGGIDDDHEFGRHRLEHDIDQLVLGREPVQDRLRTDPDQAGDLVERHGIDTARAELVDRRIEDALSCWRLGHRRPH